MADSGSPAYEHVFPSSPAKPEAKRRKLRKGTRSCWECKRRKNKCTWSRGKGKCDGCHHRDTACRGQEFPDEHVSQARRGTNKSDDKNLKRLESLVEKLARQVHSGGEYTNARSISDDKGEEPTLTSKTTRPCPDPVVPSPIATSPCSRISNNTVLVSLLCLLCRVQILSAWVLIGQRQRESGSRHLAAVSPKTTASRCFARPVQRGHGRGHHALNPRTCSSLAQ